MTGPSLFLWSHSQGSTALAHSCGPEQCFTTALEKEPTTTLEKCLAATFDITASPELQMPEKLQGAEPEPNAAHSWLEWEIE